MGYTNEVMTVKVSEHKLLKVFSQEDFTFPMIFNDITHSAYLINKDETLLPCNLVPELINCISSNDLGCNYKNLYEPILFSNYYSVIMNINKEFKSKIVTNEFMEAIKTNNKDKIKNEYLIVAVKMLNKDSKRKRLNKRRKYIRRH